MQDDINSELAKARLAKLEEIQEEQQPEGPVQWDTTAHTIGQIITEHSVAMRRKYGRYKSPGDDDYKNVEPLPGHEDDEVPALPWEWPEIRRSIMPANRQDDRTRIRPLLP